MSRIYQFLCALFFLIAALLFLAGIGRPLHPQSFAQAIPAPLQIDHATQETDSPQDDADTPPERHLDGLRRGGPPGPPLQRGGRGPRFEDDEREWVDEMRSRMRDMRRDRPELSEKMEELRRENAAISQLNREYHQEENPQKKEQIEKQLYTHLEKRFDIQLQQQKMQLDLLEQEISKLKKVVELKEKHREQLIKKSMQDTLESPQTETRFRPPREREEFMERYRSIRTQREQRGRPRN
jgi:chromosome segregation ATPase